MGAFTFCQGHRKPTGTLLVQLGLTPELKVRVAETLHPGTLSSSSRVPSLGVLRTSPAELGVTWRRSGVALRRGLEYFARKGIVVVVVVVVV